MFGWQGAATLAMSITVQDPQILQQASLPNFQAPTGLLVGPIEQLPRLSVCHPWSKSIGPGLLWSFSSVKVTKSSGAGLRAHLATLHLLFCTCSVLARGTHASSGVSPAGANRQLGISAGCSQALVPVCARAM